MSESEAVKMVVVLLPFIAFVLTALVAYITEIIRKRHSVNLFKDKEALKLLRYMRSEESKRTQKQKLKSNTLSRCSRFLTMQKSVWLISVSRNSKQSAIRENSTHTFQSAVWTALRFCAFCVRNADTVLKVFRQYRYQFSKIKAYRKYTVNLVSYRLSLIKARCKC